MAVKDGTGGTDVGVRHVVRHGANPADAMADPSVVAVPPPQPVDTPPTHEASPGAPPPLRRPPRAAGSGTGGTGDGRCRRTQPAVATAGV